MAPPQFQHSNDEIVINSGGGIGKGTRKGSTKLSLMIAGKHGLGKTTLLSTLFPHAIKPSMQRTTIIKNKEYICSPRSTEKPIKYLFDHLVGDDHDIMVSEKIKLLITDMPGYSDLLSITEYIEMIKEEILIPFGEVLYEEGRIHRNPKFIDNRVHCLLYLIDPIPGTGVRELDLRIIRELAPLVNIVPLLAKSDNWIRPGTDDNIETYCKRASELNQCKKEIRRALEGIEYFDLEDMVRKDEANRMEDEREKIALLSTSMSSTKSSIRNMSIPSFNFHAPLAVMGANRNVRILSDKYLNDIDDEFIVNPIDSSLLPVNNDRYRKYHWGHLSCDDENISDVNLLSTLLLIICRNDLREKTVDNLYERFRTERLLEQKEEEMEV